MVLKTPNGNVLICGCCHAGILNTFYHVEEKFGGPILAVVGGTHLMSADDEYLEQIIDVFQNRYPDCEFYLNHCTGKNAIDKLKDKFKDKIHAFPAGSVVEFPEYL